MKTLPILCLALANLALAAPNYPKTKKEPTIFSTFGQNYQDPFAWMENGDDPDLAPWLRQQNALVKSHLDGDIVKDLAAEFQGLFAKKTLVETTQLERNDREFLRHRYLPFGVARKFTVDSHARYQIQFESDTHSDLQHLIIYDKKEKKFLKDRLKVKFSEVVWEPGDISFVYSSDRDSRLGGTVPIVRRHILGTRQLDDEVLYEAPTHDTWVTLHAAGTRPLMEVGNDKLITLRFLGDTKPQLTLGSESYVLKASADGLKIVSHTNAPMGQLLAFDFKTKTLTTLVPERTHVIDQVLQMGDSYFISYIKDAAHQLYRFENGKAPQPISLPDPGRARMYKSEGNLHVSFQTYSQSPVVLTYDEGKNILIPKDAELPKPSDLESFRVFYRSPLRDQIPIWILKSKTTKLTPATPVYLYGYGGFRINILPYYSRQFLPWLKRGGVVAFVTLPGGLEYGEDWHRAGNRFNKKEVFSHFALAAKHLIMRGWTSPASLSLGGASNGGLLVAATAQFYPHLFSAAVPEVGVLDMVRFSKFTAGKWWTWEYGNPKREQDFRHLWEVSPYHQLKPQAYPHMLVITGDHDDRVVPAHSYKYAAKLQQVQDPGRDALLYAKRYSSHSWWSGSVQSRIEYLSLKWGFLVEKLM